MPGRAARVCGRSGGEKGGFIRRRDRIGEVNREGNRGKGGEGRARRRHWTGLEGGGGGSSDERVENKGRGVWDFGEMREPGGRSAPSDLRVQGGWTAEIVLMMCVSLS
jgi:hypothetical protein